MTDYAGGAYGGFTFPLSATASTSAALLLAADPAIFYTLDFLGTMITTHLGSRIVAEAAAIGLTWSSAVMYAVPTDPQRLLTEEQFKFPLMAMHRTTSAFSDKTVHYRRKITDVSFYYVFPSLTSGQFARLSPLLTAVESVIAHRVEQGADPSYTPSGGSAGDSVWGRAGIDFAEVTSGRMAAFTAEGSNLFMPMWNGTLRIAERASLKPADFEALGTAQLNIDVYDPATVTSVADVAIIRTDTD